MALGAIFSEELLMPVLILVAGVTIQGPFQRGYRALRFELGRSAVRLFHPPNQPRRVSILVAAFRGLELTQSNSCQLVVVHGAGNTRAVLVLDMAGSAFRDTCMESGRLTLQKIPVVGVTHDAIDGFYTGYWRMAR